LSGGKYEGNKGFDHVFQDAAGEIVLLLDSKQLTNGAAKLQKGVGNSVQLTEAWIDSVLAKLDVNSEVYKKVSDAVLNGTLVKGVVGVDRATGKVTVIRVK
jgi:filamentous hemagglutinin